LGISPEPSAHTALRERKVFYRCPAVSIAVSKTLIVSNISSFDGTNLGQVICVEDVAYD